MFTFRGRKEEPTWLLTIYIFIFCSIPSIRAQICNSDSISNVLFLDLTYLNSALAASIELYADANITSSTIQLTTDSPGSYGGIFMKSPMEFQGTGGFSLKFGIMSKPPAAESSGTWEVVITNLINKEVLPPPFAPGFTSNGRSGWSRRDALVIEIDSTHSISSEQDSTSNHIMVSVSESKICTGVAPASLSTGEKHLIWVDYDGFATVLHIRVGAMGAGSRPIEATLSCVVDIWGLLSISSTNQIGFTAYSDSKNPGTEHSLVDVLALSDAYRPYDDSKCESYSRCAPRSTDFMQCVRSDFGTSGMCEVVQCDPNGFVWDVMGSMCCAFVEKSSLVVSPSAGVGPFDIGELVPCVQERKVLAYSASGADCLGQ